MRVAVRNYLNERFKNYTNYKLKYEVFFRSKVRNNSGPIFYQVPDLNRQLYRLYLQSPQKGGPIRL